MQNLKFISFQLLTFVQIITSCHDVDLHKFSTIDYRSITSNNIKTREIHNARVQRRSGSKTIIRNVHVFDGYVMQPASNVVIDGDLIGDEDEDESEAQYIDGDGGYLIPGLIDSHCHPLNVSHLQDLTSNGVTTAFSMACYSSTMCESLQGHIGLVDIKKSTAPAAAPGSLHGNLSFAATHSNASLLSNADQVSTWLSDQTSWNPYLVKGIAESPGLDQTTLSAIAAGAKHLNKLSACHATSYEAYRQAITAGFSQIHHAPLDKAVDASLISLMVQQQQISAPTLAIMKAIANKLYPASYSFANSSVTAINDAKIPILAGTDANQSPGIPANVTFGSSLHDELELLVAAGLTPLEALRAATINPSQHYGLTDRGVIAKGKKADLLLLGGNPLLDIKASRDIKVIWAAGIQYKPQDANSSTLTNTSTTFGTSPVATSSSSTVNHRSTFVLGFYIISSALVAGLCL